MFAWGVISILQCLLLPGLLITLRMSRLQWPERLLLAIPLSLILNYFLVLSLVLAGAYTRTALVVIVVIELGLLALSAWKARSRAHLGPGSVGRGARTISLPAADTALGALVAVGLIPFAYTAYVQAGTIFTLWDAVVSWNRWAIVWHNGGIPRDSLTYPQAIPVLYSMIYKFIGDPEVQFFPKALAVAYPLVAAGTLVRIASLHAPSRFVALLSVPIFVWLAGQQYSGLIFVFGGYVDAVIAYFAVVAVYLFALLARARDEDPGRFWDDRRLYLALVIVSGAAIVKQTGGFLALLFPLAVYWYLGRNGAPFWRMPLVWLWGTVCAFIVGHWYIFKFIQFHAGIDSAGAAAYGALIPGAFLMRPIRGAAMFFDAVGWLWAAPFAIGLLNPIARRIAAWGVLPLFAIWAFTVSYDLRGLFITLPWIALVMAAGCVIGARWTMQSKLFGAAALAWTAALGWQTVAKAPTMMLQIADGIPLNFLYGVMMILVICVLARIAFSGIGSQPRIVVGCLLGAVAGLVLLTAHFSSQAVSSRLRAESLAQQQRLGDPELNGFLLEFFANRPWSPGDIATSHQYLGFVPGLKDHYRYAPCKYDAALFGDPSIRYYLTSFACPYPDTSDTISRLPGARKVRAGATYEFYELNRGAPMAATASSVPARPLVANNFSDAVWNKGVRTDSGNADMFYFLADSAADNPVKVGTNLTFAGAGRATVREVAVTEAGGRVAVFVRVDRPLRPDRDGFPHPIAVH